MLLLLELLLGWAEGGVGSGQPRLGRNGEEGPDCDVRQTLFSNGNWGEGPSDDNVLCANYQQIFL